MRRLLLLMFIALLASGCAESATPPAVVEVDLTNLQPIPARYSEGVMPLRISVAAIVSPQGTAESYQPLLDYLSQATGRPVQLVQRRTYQETNDLIERGEVDVAFVCTSAYLAGRDDFGLELLAAAREHTGLPVVTEVMEPEQVDLVAAYADMLQIGSRNMANVPLLRRAAATQKPILLKRGFAATIEEWLLAAEYILAEGNDRVVLCERGIRSFDPSTRFTLDLNAVPLVRQLTHLPIVVDPSHGTGLRELVPAMSLAAIAAGAHGLILETHPDPDSALCDGPQAISAEDLALIVERGRAITGVLAGRPAAVIA